MACVGDDASGRDIRAALRAEGIGVDGMMVTGEAATGTALIVVDGEGRNQIAVAPGANWRLSVEHVRSRADDFAWAQVVLCQLETPLETLELALGEARRRGLVTVLNPAVVPSEPCVRTSSRSRVTRHWSCSTSRAGAHSRSARSSISPTSLPCTSDTRMRFFFVGLMSFSPTGVVGLTTTTFIPLLSATCSAINFDRL